MLTIVAKKKLQFRNSTLVDNPQKPGEKMAVDSETFVAEPSFRPQLAPDWIKQDGLFDLAVRDKSLVVVGSEETS